MKIFEFIISKIFSARFVITVLIVGTYCNIINRALSLLESKEMPLADFMGIFLGFALLAKEIVEAYFKMNENAINTVKTESTKIETVKTEEPKKEETK